MSILRGVIFLPTQCTLDLTLCHKYFLLFSEKVLRLFDEMKLSFELNYFEHFYFLGGNRRRGRSSCKWSFKVKVQPLFNIDCFGEVLLLKFCFISTTFAVVVITVLGVSTPVHPSTQLTLLLNLHQPIPKTFYSSLTVYTGIHAYVLTV